MSCEEVTLVLNHLLHYTSVTDFLILNYLADWFDFFTLPRSIQQRIEDRHCKFNKLTPDIYTWTLFGRAHGPRDEPASINGNHFKIWQKCGLTHRDNNDQPALYKIKYFGNPDDKECEITEEWHHKGLRHRETGPAIIRTFSNGIVYANFYKENLEYLEDLKTRIQPPAFVQRVYYNDDGESFYSEQESKQEYSDYDETDTEFYW